MLVNNFECNFHHCCFFYPLRKGLLVWGYLNLMRYCVLDGISSTLAAYRILFHFKYPEDDRYQDLLSLTVMFIATLSLSLANLVFNIIFVVGMHKRDERLLRPHYYYWMVTLVVYVIFYVGANILGAIFESFHHWLDLHVDPVSYHLCYENPVIGIVDIVGQIYFLILVRNQIRYFDKGDQRAIIDFDFESRYPSRPQSMAETVRNVIETQPKLNTHRF